MELGPFSVVQGLFSRLSNAALASESYRNTETRNTETHARETAIVPYLDNRLLSKLYFHTFHQQSDLYFW